MSPFEIFRRNLKPLMILLTGLALFAFVVLPVLDSYMRTGSGGSADPVVARVGGQNLKRTRVDYFTQNHQSTIRFLGELAQLTIDRGGSPQTPGFQYDTQNNQVRSLGINQQPGFEGTIRTLMLANEAAGAGFELDDNTLQVWMEQFTNGMISDGEVNALLQQSSQNRMARPHLYEQLRNHLLADVYLRRGYAGLYASGGRGPLMTPSEQWESFLRLNQTATATTYGVLVNDYLEQTNQSPSESEVLEMYEEGKDRDSQEQSPDAGFHRKYTAKFEYLVGSNQTFLDEEVAKLKDDDIRAEYKRRLKGGDFQLPETAKTETEKTETPAVKPVQQDKTEEAKPEDAKEDAEDSKKEQPSTKKEMKEDVAKEKVAEPDEKPKSDEKPETEEKPDAPATEKAEESVETKTEKPQADAPQKADDQSSRMKPHAIRLVALRANEAPQEDESSDKKENATSDQEAKDKPVADQGEAVEAKPKDAKLGAKEKKADPQDAEEKADAKAGDAKKTDAPKQKEKPKVESFEDVREQIAEEMAGPAARRRMDIALGTIQKEMRNFFVLRSIAGEKQPAKPDLEAMAKKHGFRFETIGPYDSQSISDEPIANSHDVGTEFGQRGPSFQVIMYGFDNGQTQLPRQVLFSPVQTADDPAGKKYVAWKVEEIKAYSPTLDEARDEVVMALRMKEARILASEAAEAIAKGMNESSEKSLADFVPENKQDNIIEIAQPFSWMDSFGFSGATIGNVPQLDSVGVDFMKAVFHGEQGEYDTATNQPQRVVYVVSPKEFKPSVDELRVQFRQPTNRLMAMMTGGGDVRSIVDGFFQAIDEKNGYETFSNDE